MNQIPCTIERLTEPDKLLIGALCRRADPKKFISLCSLLVAVGEDSDIWKWYGIKRKRLIEFMLITWDLEEKVFCCNHP